MTPERWKQVEEIFHAALELPLSERSGFLDHTCADDEELRREVTSLLASQEKADSFIESYPDDVVAGMIIAEAQVRSMIGRTLGRYHLRSLIGSGGMGEVYRASDTRLDRDVAVKILPVHLAADQAALRRFEREAKAVAALSHPNILAIFDFGSEEGVSYAVMELLEGQTLRSSLRAGPLGWQRTTEIGGAISEGLAVAHARGIIHRDLKPENIFLNADGNLKILDFGIAKLKRPISAAVDTGSSTVGETTARGVVMGTLSYMSPEQVRGDVADAPSDIFSMGSVLYEMTTGVRPFARATDAETIAAILKDEPAPLARAAKRVPAEFERVIRHCLEKRADDRYQSARDLAVDLRALLRGTGHSISLDLEAKLERAGGTEPGDDVTRLKQPLSISSFTAASPASQESLRDHLEPVGGAVPLGSKFYIARPTDDEFRAAIARQDSIVLVKGARQVGKTSLLARGLQHARGADAKVIMTDFQELTAAYLESVETLILTLAESFADQLERELSFAGKNDLRW